MIRDLTEGEIEALSAAAKAASALAYAPYSKFRVGAAILTECGEIIAGSNVENASYGLTICAERNAVFQAVARGKRVVLAVAVYTPTAVPTAPCGACRQVLNEFGPDAHVFCLCDGPETIRSTLARMLPGAFGPNNLKDSQAPIS